jgi:hypothetical protein
MAKSAYISVRHRKQTCPAARALARAYRFSISAVTKTKRESAFIATPFSFIKDDDWIISLLSPTPSPAAA